MSEAERLELYKAAISKWGIEAQVLMVMEETGEMLNALAKANRGRSTLKEIITELVDVSIMMEQMAFYFGWEEFKEEKQRKLERLGGRLND
jgi:NTP pyrophosphatase (non-canonical NTP hydrolase)